MMSARMNALRERLPAFRDLGIMRDMLLSQLSRRDAFRTGLAGVAAFGFGAACTNTKTPVEANGRVLPAEAIDSEVYGLSLTRFIPHLGSVFRFERSSGGAVELTLTHATDLGVGERPIWDKGECFSLSFAAEAGSPPSELVQDTYAVSHAALGSFSIFIVPATTTADAQSYTAVFNRV